MPAKKPTRRKASPEFTTILQALELHNRAIIQAVTSSFWRVDQRIDMLERNVTAKIKALESRKRKRP